MARKALNQPSRADVVETFLVKRSGERPQAGLLLAHAHRADHRAEHEPVRRLVLGSSRRPTEPHAAVEAVVDAHRIRPDEIERLFRWRMDDERVGERHASGIEGAARGAQRLVRLEHDREFGEVEAADMHQGSGALLGRDRTGMGKSVAHLAQRYRAKQRRQVEFRGCGRARDWHFPARMIRLANNYSLLAPLASPAAQRWPKGRDGDRTPRKTWRTTGPFCCARATTPCRSMPAPSPRVAGARR